MSIISSTIKRYPLVTFFILAYALSWWLFPVGGGALPHGPMLAAIIVLAFTQGRAGLKALLSQATHRRFAWIWYLIAPGIVLAYSAAAVGLNLLLGAQVSPTYEPLSVIDLLVTAIICLLLLGMWEEPGWTGYALPRLRAGRSLLLASLILAVFRTLWHLPLFLGGDIPWSDIVANFAGQIIISWVYYRTDRGLLPAMLVHFGSNFVNETIFSLFQGVDRFQFEWLQTGLACLIVIGLIIYDRQMWFARPSPAQPEIVREPVAGV